MNFAELKTTVDKDEAVLRCLAHTRPVSMTPTEAARAVGHPDWNYRGSSWANGPIKRRLKQRKIVCVSRGHYTAA